MKVNILRIDKGKKETLKDTVTDEVFLTIHINDKELLTLLCSLDNLKELSVGFLFSSGIITSLDDIENVFVNNRNMTSHITLKEKILTEDVIFKRTYTSGCGTGMLFHNVLDLSRKKIVTSNLRVHSEKIFELMKAFEKKSTAYKKTGGVHSAALCDEENILAFCEDIGRHNAIDKVIGEALYKKLDTKDLIVLTSGRISSEVISKVEKMGSGIIISRGAPTSLAVQLAEKWNITLVGFVRGHRMNVYTAKERIL